jgi:hypothetical protein
MHAPAHLTPNAIWRAFFKALLLHAIESAWGGLDGTGRSTVQTKVKGPTVLVTTNVGNATHPILVADNHPTRWGGCPLGLV